MATVFVMVRSERVTTHVCDWAMREGLEHYVAPRQESTERLIADHVTIENISEAEVERLRQAIKASGWKAEIEVE